MKTTTQNGNISSKILAINIQMLVIPDLSTNPPEVETPFTFPLDPFQKHAIYAISKDENVLVTAKTGSGKTLVGEFQIWHSLKKGKRVFYTTPIKSLSNQKFHDLKKIYGNRVGIMTGDIKFMPQADIVIMTTEILRNLLYKQGTATENIGITASLSLDNLDAVVFDEVHYINDNDRGKVWEECLTLLAPSVNLVLLSATIDSPEFFADWLGKIKNKPIHLLSTKYRIVPLVHTTPEGDVFMDAKENFHEEVYAKWVRKYYNDEDELRKHRERVKAREEGQDVVERDVRTYSFVDRMNKLINKMDLPALFFVFSRKNCEEYAKKVSNNMLLTSSETADVKHIIKFHLHRYTDLLKMEQYHSLVSLLEKGIAFHHSGLLPVLKEIIEILFAKGFVKVLFATETFAVGINMPTKTVVFTSFRKPNDENMRMLKTSEYMQMAGRAGRRGKDDKGIVIYLPVHKPEDPFEVKQMLTGKSDSVSSKLKFDYSYILSMLQSGKSIEKQTFKEEIRLTEIQYFIEKIEEESKKLPEIQPDVLEELENKENIETQLKTAVNKGKTILQSALQRWNNAHMGPKWADHQKNYKNYKKNKEQISRFNREIEILSKNDEMELFKSILEKFGYIQNNTLTKLGTLAAEIHEGHPLLMSKLYESRMVHNESAEIITEILSCFLEMPHTEEIIEKDDIVESLRRYGRNIYIAENYIHEPEYWELTEYWMAVVHDWINGETFVCEKYGVEQGNFVRAMLKLSNIIDEWINISTICEDVEMIEKMKDMKNKVVRDFVIPDSLYLRI